MTTFSPASPRSRLAMSWADIMDVDMCASSDIDTASVVSFEPFGNGSVSSATDMQDQASMSSGASVFSMSSSIRAQSFKHEYGRDLNNYSEVYQLPADDEELDRLDRQHTMFKEVMGRYPPPMWRVLAEPPPGEQPVACLDLGCGSGCWILEVARDFPHCSCVAVDLIPMQVVDLPPNCRSEIDDINLGLQHYQDEFNVINARLVASGVRDYAGLVDQASQALRPNGLIVFTEFDFTVCGTDKKSIVFDVPELSPPYLPRWMSMVRAAVIERGGEVDAANHLYRWVSEHPLFTDVVYRSFLFPTSPWFPSDHPDAARMNRAGSLMREDIQTFLRGARPLLLSGGMDEAFVDAFEQKADEELRTARLPHFIHVQNVYARRRP
ncbi:S-adenosyl-L-methionine-dependent methyltransferase [Thelephora terrestris]|uniref:S-adenosyl-L-methionine-dependent methyltransferase n=1 Tax=Thelephora terrestris TaxID=56493 RepID=A0A9P6HH76_9AGAM|nr:S-adenosyl-L-methionine-dependent methyltransferase [Thelephora terrestris]